MNQYSLFVAVLILCVCTGPKASEQASSASTLSEKKITSSAAFPSRTAPPEATAAATTSSGLDKVSDRDWSSSIPSEWNSVRGGEGQSLAPGSKKRFMDMFSWQEFIALSWPVSWRRTVDEGNLSCDQGSMDMFGSAWEPAQQFPTQSEITPDNCPRWMTWHNRREIVLRTSATAPTRCEIDPVASQNRLEITSKVGFHDWEAARGALLTGSAVPSMDVPLIDQNGQKVYYDILINESAYHELKCFQQLANSDHPKSLDFQHGESATSGSPGQPGATELKLAWKVLDPQQDRNRRDRFVRRTVLIPDESGSNANCEVNPNDCTWKKVEVGLVGIHIVHKSREHAQWIWSTFEQIDNDPSESTSNAVLAGSRKSKFSFFGGCVSCTHNVPPHAAEKSQLTRTEDIASDTAELNGKVRQMLSQKGSVLQYYQLVGTQYDPTNTIREPDLRATPSLLRNTVIEPYIETIAKAPSCIGCHFERAQLRDSCCHLTAPRQKACFADFSFLAGRMECAAPQAKLSPAG